MNTQYHRARVPCRLCKGEMDLQWDKECPDDWVDALYKVVVCNRCYVIQVDIKDITNRLFVAANSLYSIRECKKATAETEKGYHAVIVELMGRYVNALKQVHKCDDIPVLNFFIEKIFNQPQDVGTVLASYRKAAREHVEREKNKLKEKENNGQRGIHKEASECVRDEAAGTGVRDMPREEHARPVSGQQVLGGDVC